MADPGPEDDSTARSACDEIEIISFTYPTDETRLFVRGLPEDIVIVGTNIHLCRCLCPSRCLFSSMQLALLRRCTYRTFHASFREYRCCPLKTTYPNRATRPIDAHCMAQSYPHLFAVFARFGPLHEVQLQQLSGNDYRLGQPSASAYAFVQYYSVGDTQAALQACRQRRVHVHHHAVIASPVGRRAVRWTTYARWGSTSAHTCAHGWYRWQQFRHIPLPEY